MSVRLDPPSLASGAAAVARLQWKRLVRGRKLRLGYAALALIALTAVIGHHASGGNDPRGVMQTALGLGYFNLTVFLVPFLLASGAIGEEVESRTLVYLVTRASGRSAVVLGKLGAALLGTIPAVALSVALLHVGLYITSPADLVGEAATAAKAIGAISLLSAYYCAVCLCWGAVVPEAAGLVAALHLAVFELALRFIPGVFRMGSMNYWARQLTGLPPGGLMPELLGPHPLYPGVIATAVLTLAFTLLAVAVVHMSELRSGDG